MSAKVCVSFIANALSSSLCQLDEAQLDDAHNGLIRALAVVEHEGAPLIVSGSDDGDLRSWWLDGTRGAGRLDDAHSGWINALAVVGREGARLIVSAGYDRTIVLSRVADAGRSSTAHP